MTESIAGDRFTVRRKLGEGGMGVVYEALDRERGTVVALKTLAAADAAGIYRLKKEFRALVGISHPNLVVLHELFCSDDRWFLVMELVHGVDFVRWVRGVAGARGAPTVTRDFGWDEPFERAPASMAAGSFDEPRLRNALAQLASALGALHRAGRLHCDLKPSNVLVDEDGRLTILDFGIARIHAAGAPQMSLESTIVGTPAYMAPEQASGEGLSPATDWYGLGVMLYEAMTGVVPFGGSIAELVTSKQYSEPPDPRELVRGLPDDLAALCVELLRPRPEQRPSGDDVARQLIGAPVASQPARSTLWGRDGELATLREAHEHARRGAELVLVEGGPGVGKSALLRAFARSLPEGAVILIGSCHERENMPYKAFDAVVDALGRQLRRDASGLRALPAGDVRALARLFPVVARLADIAGVVQDPRDPRELRRRAFAALRQLLAGLAREHPVAILIDDLARGDADSAALLAELLAPPLSPQLLVVGTARTADVAQSALMRVVMSPEWSERVGAEPLRMALGPLSVTAAEGLAGELCGAAAARAVAHEAHGNPELVVELATHAHVHGVGGVLRLDEMWAARLGALSSEARQLLEVLAVAGGPLSPWIAAAASSVSAERSMRAFSELSSVRLVVSRVDQGLSEEIDVYHAPVRAFVLRDLSAERVRSYHLALGRALERASGDPERVAHHFEEAGERALAAEFYERAARAAEQALAFERAAQLLRRADRPELAERLGNALACAGRSADAAEAYLAAARISPQRRIELERVAAEHLLRSGHIDEGMRVMKGVLDELGLRLPASPRGALASLLFHRARLRLRGLEPRAVKVVDERARQAMDACWSMAVGMSMVDSVVGADFHARHLLHALGAGDQARLARALALEAAHVGSTGGDRHVRVAALLDRAEALGGDLGDAHAVGLARMARAAEALFSASWRQAVAFGDEAVALFRDRCVNVAWEIASAQRFAFVGLYYLGDISELSRRMPEAVADARARGDLFAESCVRSGSSIVVWLARDEASVARRQLEDEARRWGDARFAVQHYLALQGLTYVDLYEGRPAEALARMRRVWRRLERSHLLRMELLRVTMLSLRARTAFAAGDTALAERDAARLERNRMPSAGAVARLVRAALANRRGDRDKAIASYRLAIAELDRLEMKLLSAAARWRLAELGSGDGTLHFDSVAKPHALVAALAP